MDFSLRPVTVGDVDDLRQLYRESVATLGPAAYSAAQVAAWQAFAAQPGFADFVLTPFTKAEREVLPNLLADAADATELVITDGLLEAQQRFHAPRE